MLKLVLQFAAGYARSFCRDIRKIRRFCAFRHELCQCVRLFSPVTLPPGKFRRLRIYKELLIITCAECPHCGGEGKVPDMSAPVRQVLEEIRRERGGV